MRILVTGHQGYIGCMLVSRLLEKGFIVAGLDSGLFERCVYGSPAPRIPEIRKDVRDVSREDLEGFDAVLHLAALSNDPLGNLNPTLTYDINFRASVRLARLAREAGVRRFVFSSSCSTYGAAGNDLVDEEAKFAPVTPYGRSKMLAERELVKLADERFIPTFLRNATAYGASPRLRFDLVLNNLVAWAMTSGLVFLKSDGSPWRPVVHVNDIAQAFLAVLEAPEDRVRNEAFNVGGTLENYRVRDLADIVKAVVPGCRIEFAQGAGPDTRCYRVDCGKLSRALPDFQLRWNAERGARELYELYQTHGLTVEDFEGSRYKRVAHLQHLLNTGVVDAKLRRCGVSETGEAASPVGVLHG